MITLEAQSTDMVVQDGYMCHQSGPNTEQGHIQKGDSIRLITAEATFDPRPRQGAAFTKQISARSGNLLLDCSAAPVVFDGRR